MKKFFSLKILTSFCLFLSFMILLVSGVILYVYPEGGGSGVMAEFGGLTKPVWLNQHIIFGLVFTLFALYHLFFINWTPFLSYLKKKKNEGWQRPAELVATVILTSFIAIGTYAHIQPFPALLGTGRSIAGSPARNENDAPTVNDNSTVHAEQSLRRGEEDHYDERHASPSLASRWEESEGTAGTSVRTSAENSGSQSVDNGAPDDELHRQTRRSCASCH